VSLTGSLSGALPGIEGGGGGRVAIRGAAAGTLPEPVGEARGTHDTEEMELLLLLLL
jgi:hypothetical protein